jgi:hypothetical protein|tara:strand:+ start:3720 stop:3842 length:123 start_codon:yes stop_codon:yes gene_type:complete
MTGQEAMDKLKDRDIGSFTREEIDEIQEAILPTKPITEEK